MTDDDLNQVISKMDNKSPDSLIIPVEVYADIRPFKLLISLSSLVMNDTRLITVCI